MNSDEIPAGYLRVTEVLQPFSKLDLINPEVLAKAADRGTRVHKYCEMHALGLFVEEYDQDCKNYVEAFKKWFDEWVVEVLFMEVRLNHEKYRISGKPDMVARLKYDKEPSLIDFKTPQAAQISWDLQTAAYDMLIEDIMGVKVGRRFCLMLPKDDSRIKISEYYDRDKSIRLYLNALELYRFYQ